jgi:peptide deformylase
MRGPPRPAIEEERSMAILKVARLGHPVLRRVAEPLTRGQIRSAEIQRLIDDMIETMREHDGVGLAATQVHVGQRLLVVEIPASADGARQCLPLTVLANPVITPLGEERANDWEGCLSLPDLRGQVPRFTRVKVEALDRQGRPLSMEVQDFSARVVQHECDHLDGVLFPDRMADLTSLSFQREFERFVVHDGDVAED